MLAYRVDVFLNSSMKIICRISDDARVMPKASELLTGIKMLLLCAVKHIATNLG
jgi:hypothetical protein